MTPDLQVLVITSEWPTDENPNAAPFVVRQVEFLRRAGVRVDVFHFRGAKNPLNYLKAWRQAQKRIANSAYDLIHAQWGQSALLALPKRRPLVITFRGGDLSGIVGRGGHYTIAGRVLKKVSKAMARRADQVIVVSESLARQLPKRNYHVIPSGLDLELFRPIPQAEARKQLNLPVDQKLVLFAAALGNPVKRYSLAKAAVAALDKKFDVQLITVTDAPHALMPAYMNACDALLLTSLYEGSPNVVKEALACDLSVVSVDVGDVRQRIGSVAGCIVCADDSVETISAALDQVLTSDARIDGRRRVNDLDETKIAERVISTYRLALSND